MCPSQSQMSSAVNDLVPSDDLGVTYKKMFKIRH